MKNFKRLTLSREITADADGCPVIRSCFEHETLLSFWDDEGNYAFNDWWHIEGSKLFNKWVLENDEYKHCGEL